MAKTLDPQISQRINSLVEFEKILSAFGDNLDKDQEFYKTHFENIDRMKTSLAHCIQSFQSIDDSSSNKFAREIECLNKTYDLIFINSDKQHCEAYTNYATKLLNSTENKQKLGTAMKWIGGLTVILSPIAFVLAASPMIIVAICAVPLLALLIMIEGFRLESYYSDKIALPKYMAGMGKARNGFFKALDDGMPEEDQFIPEFKKYCREHQEELPAELPNAFNTFLTI